MRVEVYGVGEILVDIIPIKPGPPVEGKSYEIHFGGAPANTIVGIARLGHKAGMVAAVGNDQLGDFLINTLKKNNVDHRFVVRKNARTTIAFVILHENGERDFFFYRKPWSITADTMLEVKDIDPDEILKAKIIHFSGFSLSHPPIRDTILYLMKKAYESGVKVSFDPNYRRDIWSSVEDAVKLFRESLRYTYFLTLSLEELYMLYPEENYKKAAEVLMEKHPNIEVVAVRLGNKGVYVKARKESYELEAFKVKAIDTTGAGDAWTAGFITFYLLENKKLREAIYYANKIAAITVTRRGAITAFPYRHELGI
jgi:fructokinase